MNNIRNSVAFRLALICGGLVVASVVMVSAVFYFGTVGVLASNVDNKIGTIAQRFAEDAERRGSAPLSARIERTLSDGVDSDTEIYLLTDPAGHRIAGNIAPLADGTPPVDRAIDHAVVRSGRPSVGRVLVHRLPDGAFLVVGRDMSDLNRIRDLIGRAIVMGGLLALLLALGGTILFRRQIEGRIWAIRHTALDIEAGNLGRRIPVSGEPDEFDRLSADINRMLDRIEHLMEGVRHVSNTIAHNLRTPLGRIRGHLDEALHGKIELQSLAAAGDFAIEEIDGLIVVLDKLLQIAEAESGTRRRPFAPVALRDVVTDLLELYDAAAEERGIAIVCDIQGEPVILSDKDLLASILANLLDNSLKYAGSPATVTVRAFEDANAVTLAVQDDGPGIPAEERAKVLQRFYRLDSRQQGNGLGLSIVAAFTHLHGGVLYLEDAAPGLRVRIVLPRADAATFPNGNNADTLRIGAGS